MEEKEEKTVLVTVGSTQFEDLIKLVDTEEFGRVVVRKGYNKLLIQFGPKGEYEPHVLAEACKSNPLFKGKLEVRAFRMDPDFKRILQKTDLLVSHAGSGTILEALGLSRPMIVVINEKLADNHQFEIADVMAENNYLFKSSVDGLLKTLEEADVSKLVPYPPPTTTSFANYLDGVMGFA